MTASDMQNRQELTDRLSAAATNYAREMSEPTRRAYFAAVRNALKADMPADLIESINAAAVANTMPVSLR